jgi:hypothetical protein
MEHPEGMHGREMCSFLWVVQAKGVREIEIRICCALGKLES